MRIVRQKHGFHLSLPQIEKILKKLNHFECAPAQTLLLRNPMIPSINQVYREQSCLFDWKLCSSTEYSNKWGVFMYLMYCTRPDIAFALEMLSKNESHPGKELWSALTREGECSDQVS